MEGPLTLRPDPLRITAITPVHNRCQLTLDCLQTMFASDLEGIDLRVIVVDDGSTDDTAAAIAERFPQVRVIKGDGSLWYSGGVNAGLEAAAGGHADSILLFNNDSRFPPGTIRQLALTSRQRPGSIVGAALIEWDGGGRVFQTGMFWQTSFGGWRTLNQQTLADLPDGPWPVEVLAGNCLLAPAAALRSSGFMDAANLPNFGDCDLTARLRRQGWRLLIDPAAHVLCEPNAMPARLSAMRWPELYDALWRRRTSYHNLRQRHAMNRRGGKTDVRSVLATAVYIARLGLKSVGLAGRWPNDYPEAPLRETVRPIIAAAASHHDRLPRRTIVYAWPYIEWGGAQVYFVNLMKAARVAGHRVEALFPEALPEAHRRLVEAHADAIHIFSGAHDLGPAPTLSRKLQRRLRTARADMAVAATLESITTPETIIHIDAGPWTSSALLKRLAARNPVVMTVHTAMPKLSPWRHTLWRHHFSSTMRRDRFRLMTSNCDARRSLADFVEAGRLDRVEVSLSSFDAAVIDRVMARTDSRAALETRFGLAPTPFRIVVAAQFIPRKGRDDMLAALGLLRGRGHAIDCVWIAPSLPSAGAADQHESDRQIRLLSQADIGGTYEDYLTAVHRLSDIFVLPSHVEGLSLALVDAMALGLPCIATNINGTPEAIRHGSNGWLVPPRDAAALADAILALMQDPALRQRLGALARRDALATFELQQAAANTLHVYQELSIN
jgi:glycosyltransferase involved in cell wall biosynthesis/GT2 family glycosyltransferase